MQNNNIPQKNKQNYWLRYPAKHLKKLSDVPPLFEQTFLLDNILPLTASEQIELYTNASKIVTQRPNPSTPKGNIRKKNTITNFSENSKRNLKKKLSKINFSVYPEIFLMTLTYHNIYPANGEQLKNDIDKFEKRLKRIIPEADYIWKLEFQERGAPHIHYILFFRQKNSYKQRALFSAKLRNAWFTLLKDQSITSYKHCFDFRFPHSVDNYFKYLLKYLDKADRDNTYKNYGRRWAASEKLDDSCLGILNVDENFYYELRRKIFKELKEVQKIPDNILENFYRNYSFEFCIPIHRMLKMIYDLAKETKRSYVIAQIQNSPQLLKELKKNEGIIPP